MSGTAQHIWNNLTAHRVRVPTVTDADRFGSSQNSNQSLPQAGSYNTVQQPNSQSGDVKISLEQAKRNAEMLGLMVNEPNIKLRELSLINVPALVICGTNDMIKESHTKSIAQTLPNAKLAIIRGDHFIANKRSAEFNKAVDSFLENI